MALAADETANTADDGMALGRVALVVLGLVIAADMLFWRRDVGVSLALFGILIGLGAALLAPSAFAGRRGFVLAGILVLSVLPVAEYVQFLSLLMFAVGLAVFILMAAGQFEADALHLADKVIDLPGNGIRWLFSDVRRIRARESGETSAWLSVAAAWGIPVMLGLIYLALFAHANPVIDGWMDWLFDFDPSELFAPARVVLWGVLIAGLWPLMRIFSKPPTDAAARERGPDAADRPSMPLAGRAVLLNSLVVLNVLFVLQSGLDAVYLWGGVSLPDGMTYAEYAHRGAYPLLATALLSAVIAVAATSFWRVTGAVRWLIVLWIAQNVVLLISSILRLELYVEAYSLTYLRLGAFIWMALVGNGFLLILMRILFDRSNRWLVNANALMLATVLYGCCFVNFADLIARYNFAQKLETADGRPRLDVGYICRLGPMALPAMLDYQAQGNAFSCTAGADSLPVYRPAASWHGWGFRAWRVEQAIAAQSS